MYRPGAATAIKFAQLCVNKKRLQSISHRQYVNDEPAEVESASPHSMPEPPPSKRTCTSDTGGAFEFEKSWPRTSALVR